LTSFTRGRRRKREYTSIDEEKKRTASGPDKQKRNKRLKWPGGKKKRGKGCLNLQQGQKKEEVPTIPKKKKEKKESMAQHPREAQKPLERGRKKIIPKSKGRGKKMDSLININGPRKKKKERKGKIQGRSFIFFIGRKEDETKGKGNQLPTKEEKRGKKKCPFETSKKGENGNKKKPFLFCNMGKEKKREEDGVLWNLGKRKIASKSPPRKKEKKKIPSPHEEENPSPGGNLQKGEKVEPAFRMGGGGGKKTPSPPKNSNGERKKEKPQTFDQKRRGGGLHLPFPFKKKRERRGGGPPQNLEGARMAEERKEEKGRNPGESQNPKATSGPGG